MLTLYSYWRSSASYRVRCALNFKKLPYQLKTVDLSASPGEQLAEEYRALNPNCTVPTLQTDDGLTITQSLTAIDYIDRLAPHEPLLIPTSPEIRAQVLDCSYLIAADVHPLNNLRVLKHLTNTFGAEDNNRRAWMHHWKKQGFDAVEIMVKPRDGFAFGSSPTLADICLLAQVYNARRWDFDLNPYPNIRAIEEKCLAIDAFAKAYPDNQPDAPNSIKKK